MPETSFNAEALSYVISVHPPCSRPSSSFPHEPGSPEDMQNFDAGASKVRHPFGASHSRASGVAFFGATRKFFALWRSLRLKINPRPSGRADLEIGAPIWVRDRLESLSYAIIVNPLCSCPSRQISGSILGSFRRLQAAAARDAARSAFRSRRLLKNS